MLCHKQDFSFLGAYHHIPKYLRPEQSSFKSHRSKIAVTGTERWTSYISVVHAEPWATAHSPAELHDRKCGPTSRSVKPAHLGRAYVHIFRGLIAPSFTGSGQCDVSRIIPCMSLGLKHRGRKDLIQWTFWLMRRVRSNTERHLHRLNQEQSTNSLNLNIPLFKLHCSSYFSKKTTNNPLLTMSYMSIWGNTSECSKEGQPLWCRSPGTKLSRLISTRTIPTAAKIPQAHTNNNTTPQGNSALTPKHSKVQLWTEGTTS